MALPVFKSSATNGSPVSSATQSVTVPSGALAPAVGDVILMVSGAATGTAATITWPAGFVELAPTPGAAGYSSHVAWKVSGGTEGGTVLTITVTSASKRLLLVAVYSGVSGTPIAAQASAAQAAASLSHITPPLTTSAADQLEVAVAMDATGAGATQTTAWTFPSPLTQRVSCFTTAAAGASSMSLADSNVTPNAATANLGNRTATSTVVAVGTTWTILLAPSALALAAATVEADTLSAALVSPTSLAVTLLEMATLTVALSTQGAPVTLAVAPASGVIPFTVTATATAYTPPGTVLSYAFAWGDGGTTAANASASATHAYVSSGIYSPVCTVSSSSVGGTLSATTVETDTLTASPLSAVRVTGALREADVVGVALATSAAVASFPNASNTGPAAAGYTGLTAYTGPFGSSGAPITGTISGRTIDLGASTLWLGVNAIVQGCNIVGSGSAGGGGGMLVTVGTGVQILDNEIHGAGTTTATSIFSFIRTLTGQTTIKRNNCYNSNSEGITMEQESDILIQDNYFHDWVPSPTDAPHDDALVTSGNSATMNNRINLLHNTVLMWAPTHMTDVVAFPEQAHTVVVDNNLLGGGGYCAQFGGPSSTNFTFTNNHITTRFVSTGGANGRPFGVYAPDWTLVSNVWHGNVWDDGPDVGKFILPNSATSLTDYK